MATVAFKMLALPTDVMKNLSSLTSSLQSKIAPKERFDTVWPSRNLWWKLGSRCAHYLCE
jgi:hypothetical protein